MPLKEYYERKIYQEMSSSQIWKGQKPKNKLKKETFLHLPENVLNSKPIEEINLETFFEGENIEKEALMKNIPDTREQVKDAKEFPYCCIGLVTGKFGTQFYHGTGCLIGPRTVLTCAHNLYYKFKEMEAT